jgi:hypothetical protein
MIKPYGTCMIVEVASNDKLENTTPSPLARIGYAGSIFVCIPTALAQRSIATAVGNDSSSSGTMVLLQLPLLPFLTAQIISFH